MVEFLIKWIDVEENSDIFDREINDGVNALIVGNVDGVDNALAIVGGNCSITVS